MITKVVIGSSEYSEGEGSSEVIVEGDNPEEVAEAFLKAKEILAKKEEK